MRALLPPPLRLPLGGRSGKAITLALPDAIFLHHLPPAARGARGHQPARADARHECTCTLRLAPPGGRRHAGLRRAAAFALVHVLHWRAVLPPARLMTYVFSSEYSCPAGQCVLDSCRSA